MSEKFFPGPEIKIDPKIQNEISEKDTSNYLEKVRRGLKNNLKILKKAGEKEKNGELIKREIKNLKGDKSKFWTERFPLLREQFWEKQKIPLVKNRIEQNKLFNVAGGSISF